MTTSKLSLSLKLLIEILNDIVHTEEDPTPDSVNELHAAVHASAIIGESGKDMELYAGMFYKHYNALVWKSDLIESAERRIHYLISSPKN